MLDLSYAFRLLYSNQRNRGRYQLLHTAPRCTNSSLHSWLFCPSRHLLPRHSRNETTWAKRPNLPSSGIQYVLSIPMHQRDQTLTQHSKDNCDDSGCYGSQTAYDCSNPDGTDRGSLAGGDGSFNNPLSVAIQPGGAFQQCQIGYTTYLQKFVIFDGLCVSCATDHMDIWVQSSCSDDADSVCACEDQLTPDQVSFH